MMFEDLKENIAHEKKIVVDMRSIAKSMEDNADGGNFYLVSLRALADQLSLLNDTIPTLMKGWSSIKGTSPSIEVKKNKLSIGKQKIIPKSKGIVKMSYVSPVTKEKKLVTINKEDKKKFLKGLKLSEDSLKKIRGTESKKTKIGIRKSNPYAGFSNRYFREYSEKISPQFTDLSKDLKKGNVPLLLTSYLSMAMMSIVIVFVLGWLILGALLVISLDNWMYFILPFGLVGIVATGFYLYPANEASSVDKNISYELPFATIHMSAIAGSNISPSKIFKILIKSGEYRNVAAEIQKVVTQVDVYGYDLVTSLKNVALRTSNKKLSELFSGLATNISSGGALKNYLEKKSETFLMDYRLERQKYSALAGTFMDVYISILIAAPLIFMMMLIIMNTFGFDMGGLSFTSLLFLMITGIVLTNIVFIVVLNIKQPKV
jgi:archaeal flagellar protein FlaJ